MQRVKVSAGQLETESLSQHLGGGATIQSYVDFSLHGICEFCSHHKHRLLVLHFLCSSDKSSVHTTNMGRQCHITHHHPKTHISVIVPEQF